METRPYGSDGVRLSIVGFGAIVVMNATTDEARDRVAWAIGEGVNYFDVAPSYGDAQQMLGPALEPYRDRVFLACKTACRDAAGTATELEKSLQDMRTDRFDLYQLHALSTLEDVEQVFGPGGAMEALLRAREAGKVRYLGFSAHSEEAACGAMERFSFDSVLFPLNYAAWKAGAFGRAILETAAGKGVARLALKAMARGKWPEGELRWSKPWYEPEDDVRKADLALRWTLSHDITAALPPGEWDLFRMAVRTAKRFTPIGEAETAELMSSLSPAGPVFP
jgi:aryl-alcohol dehydrogenase-like predicted oxidoreductase